MDLCFYQSIAYPDNTTTLVFWPLEKPRTISFPFQHDKKLEGAFKVTELQSSVEYIMDMQRFGVVPKRSLFNPFSVYFVPTFHSGDYEAVVCYLLIAYVSVESSFWISIVQHLSLVPRGVPGISEVLFMNIWINDYVLDIWP